MSKLTKVFNPGTPELEGLVAEAKPLRMRLDALAEQWKRLDGSVRNMDRAKAKQWARINYLARAMGP